MYFQLAIIAVLALKVSAKADNGPQPGGVYAPQKSPVFPATMVVAAGAPTALVVGTPTTATLVQSSTLTGYPPVWTIPPTNSPEVVAAIAAIDWTKVPKIPPKKFDANSNPIVTGYAASDPDCWWSDTNCDVPKQTYLPPDIWYCPRPGDWGLTYDDGPFNQGNSAADNPYAEPALYNFLATHGNQKSTLFYIGSDVFGFPQAAQRALSDGHVICVHTWSHHPSTSLTSNQLVAESYWTARVIKEATGITPKCWRPPYGDVDDRVRAIAWQMGMMTIVWDEDTDDWDMPGSGGGTLSPATVDSYFKGWITARTSGKDNVKGHVVLEHELNNATVLMTEKWLPTLQKTFNVVTVQECMNISQPYWESQWVYPTEANPTAIANASASASASASALPSVSTNAATGTGSGSAPSATASAAGVNSASSLIVGAGALLLPVLGMMMLL